MGRLDTQDEGNRVHRIGLAGTIGTDNRSKVGIAEKERVMTLVGLEIEEFKTNKFPHLDLDALCLDGGGARAEELLN